MVIRFGPLELVEVDGRSRWAAPYGWVMRRLPEVKDCEFCVKGDRRWLVCAWHAAQVTP